MKRKNEKKEKISNCSMNNRGGFSMVEVMVAFFLLVIGIFSIVSLMAKNMKQLVDSRNQVAASLLSEEGLELARNLRDTNWLNGETAFSSERFVSDDQNNCVIDIKSEILSDCDNSEDEQKLYFDNNDHIFLHDDSGAPTKFRRKLSLDYDDPADPQELTVTSFVLWGEEDVSDPAECNSQSRCAYTQTVLTGWDDN